MGNEKSKQEPPQREWPVFKLGVSPYSNKVRKKIIDALNGRANHFDQGKQPNCVKYALAAIIYEQVYFLTKLFYGRAVNLS